MSKNYYTILTDIGTSKLAKTFEKQTTLKISQLALGDGGGISSPKPSKTQTALKNEVRRAAIQNVWIDSENKSHIILEQVVPPEVGGFNISELGVYDEDGDLIAVGNCPVSYKPKLAEGSGRTLIIKMVIMVGESGDLELVVDESSIYVTKQELNITVEDGIKAHEKTTNHPTATLNSIGFVKLRSAVGVSDSYDVPSMELINELYNNIIAAEDNASIAASEASETAKNVAAIEKEKFPISYVGRIKDGDTMISANKTGFYLVSVKDQTTVIDFPHKRDGTPLWGYGFMLVVNFDGKYWAQHYFCNNTTSAKRQRHEFPISDDRAIDVRWDIDYNTYYPPTPSEVGALSKKGDTGTSLTMTDNNAYRLKNTTLDQSTILRLDNGGDFTIINTAKGDPDGNYSGDALLRLNTQTGLLSDVKDLKVKNTVNVGSSIKRNGVEVLCKGDYGIGSLGTHFPLAEFGSYDSYRVPTGFYQISNEENWEGIEGTPPDWSDGLGSQLLIISREFELAGKCTQLFFDTRTNRLAIRSADEESRSGWSTWDEIITKKNVGGFLPSGIPLPYPGVVPPDGFVAMKGQVLDPIKQPKLYALYGKNMLDMRGDFIRGYDEGRGIDAGRKILTLQLDQMGNHIHAWGNHNGNNQGWFYSTWNNSIAGGNYKPSIVTPRASFWNGSGGGGNNSYGWGTDPNLITSTQINDSGTSSTAPRNVAFFWIVRDE